MEWDWLQMGNIGSECELALLIAGIIEFPSFMFYFYIAALDWLIMENLIPSNIIPNIRNIPLLN